MGTDLHWLQESVKDNNFYPAMALLEKCRKRLEEVLDWWEGGRENPGSELDFKRLVVEIATLQEGTRIR